MARYSAKSPEAMLHREFTKGCVAGQPDVPVKVKCNPPIPGQQPMGITREERLRMLSEQNAKGSGTNSSDGSAIRSTVDQVKRQQQLRKSALDEAVSTKGY